MTAHRIDVESWERRDAYRFFREFARPHFTMTTRLDVSRLWSARAAISPYRATLWAIGRAVAEVDAMRTRFTGEQVLRFDRIDLSTTVPRQDGSFGYADLVWNADRAAFDATAARRIAAVAAGASFNQNPGRLDLCYTTCVPWVDLVGLTNPIPGPDDCIPRIAWGKIVEEGGRARMGVALEAHHSVVDGAHVGAFFVALQSALEEAGGDLGGSARSRPA